MPELIFDDQRWRTARETAERLSQTGVDPLDLAAAQAARVALVRKFAFDALIIFGIVALVAAVALMVFRAVQGGDPIAGRELWIASVALLLILIVVALRTFLPARAGAYETAWNAFVDAEWPDAGPGDDLGAARLAFVRRMHSSSPGPFPTSAPGRKA
jgi:hypothetical protein